LWVGTVGAVPFTILFAAKAVQRRQRAAGCDFEDGPITTPALVGGPIEVAVVALVQPCVRINAVSAAGESAKAIKRGQRALRGDCEYCATAVDAAVQRCPVEVAVVALDQPSVRLDAVRAIRFGTKAVKCGQCTRGSDFEDGAVFDSAYSRSASLCRPVEVAVGGLYQADWPTAVSAVGLGAKAVKRGQHSGGSDSVDRAIVVGPTFPGSPVEIPVRG